jgi:NADH dehydrogenase [ubiquinone] 1 alpha subcomplex assembly factor 5
MINTTDAPSLLNRSGFTLTTVDTDEVTINFPSMWELIADLRDMGESNAILGRRPQIPRDVLLSAESIYKGECGAERVCARRWEESGARRSRRADSASLGRLELTPRAVRQRGRLRARYVPDHLLHWVEAGTEPAQAA